MLFKELECFLPRLSNRTSTDLRMSMGSVGIVPLHLLHCPLWHFSLLSGPFGEPLSILLVFSENHLLLSLIFPMLFSLEFHGCLIRIFYFNFMNVACLLVLWCFRWNLIIGFSSSFLICIFSAINFLCLPLLSQSPNPWHSFSPVSLMHSQSIF